MITKSNLRQILMALGFHKSEDTFLDILSIHFQNIDADISVDFTNEIIIYPEGIEADRDTTKNFSANENFVVLECVCNLFKQGYKPEHIVLEPKTPGGREDSNYYCDILIRDNDKRTYMLIECKTMDGKEDDEFNKAWKKAELDGGQLFNYYNTYRQAQYLVLYASDIVDGKPRRQYHLITMTDNKEYLESNPNLLSYEKVSADNGTKDDFFKVWSETYGKDYATNGAFEVDEVPAFGVTKKKMTIDDLIIVDGQDIQRKYHQFAQTLRQYNVASHENAFDKLVNLFLVKVVDEVRNPNDLQFLWKGAAYDDYYSFQDRLQKLYQIGMKDYLGEDVTYIDNASIENAFRMQRNDPDAIKETILEYFRQLKFYSNSDFGFLDVHNKQLFVQNAVILKAMVEMLQDMRLKTEEQNQFLGDLFEGFLDQGVKQNEGQFFTPTPITRFMVSSLPLEQIIRDNTDIPKAIDYACGAGHFLNEYASQIKPFVEQYKGAQMLDDYYKEIYGIEKEYRLSKVSKVSSFMYGQDGIQIVYGDALVPHDIINDREYKVLVANPPYSVTGFLATLSKEQRNAYVLSTEIDSKQLETNNSIETFFIERAKQMLAPEGVAAIILPSSILSNSSNIYVKTREILLQYFDFIAIAEFGSGTFGKTGTNTVVLFLRRKKSEPELAKHYRNRVEAWFLNNHREDHRYGDADAIKRYAQHIGVPSEEYITLLNGNPSEDLMKHEIFAAYKAAFSDNTVAKNIKKKKVTARYTQTMKDEELSKHIISSIRSVEKEKLYYFMLCESNPQPVIVVKSPTKTAETKKFLGYEWSNRKGSEGIKYIGAIVEEDDNDISVNKGIQQIQTPLFDPQNLTNNEKINTIIRKNYLGEEIEIPNTLTEFVSLLNIVDMLDFKRNSIDKVIQTSINKEIIIESKYQTRKIGDIAELRKGKSLTSSEFTDGNIKVVAGGIDFAGYHGEANRNANVITVSASGANAGYVNIWREPIFASDCTTIEAKDNEINQDYLYYILKSIQEQIINTLQKGAAQPHVYPNDLSSIKIPIPPKDIQKKIADECKKVDKEISNYENEIVELSEKKHIILTDSVQDKFINTTLAQLCDMKAGQFVKASSILPAPQNTHIYPCYGGNGLRGYTDTITNSGHYTLIGRQGALCGNVTEADGNFHATEHAVVVYPKEGIDSDWLFFFLADMNLNQYSTGVAQPGLSVNNILSLSVKVPESLDIRKELGKTLRAIQNKIIHIRDIIQTKPMIKQSIIDKYIK